MTDHDAARGAATEIRVADTGHGQGGGEAIRGTVRIAPAVLIELIELTVRAVPGVVGFRPRRRVERILPRSGHAGGHAGDHPSPVGGTFYEANGVRVRVHGDRIDADVTVVIARDANILELSRVIQREVGVAVGLMLGMTVTDVNIYVAAVAANGAPGGQPAKG